jgi:hypothetical protein
VKQIQQWAITCVTKARDVMGRAATDMVKPTRQRGKCKGLYITNLFSNGGSTYDKPKGVYGSESEVCSGVRCTLY